MERIKRSMRSTSSKTPDEPKSSPDPKATASPALAIRTSSAKRIRREGSTRSLASTTDASRAARVSKKARLKANNSNSQHLQVPRDDSQQRESSAETHSDSLQDAQARPSLSLERDPDDNTQKPPWTVRHRIYLDNELISSTTSTQRAGYHKFVDFLLREQIETRLYHSHNGFHAHFATRHAVLRFWNRDGTLSEKWMDKDWGGEREHEFAMENTNDWDILHLSMGGNKTPEESEEETKDDNEKDQAMEDASGSGGDEAIESGSVSAAEDADQDQDQDDDDTLDDDQDDDVEEDEDEVQPTMDITSHYLSDYDDARSIAAAPGPGTGYHWVEERRRNLEHQLREWYHCSEATCFNKGGTCIVISQSQHLHVDVKDLTDWSQMIAHAHRGIAATTLHLVAKLIDDQIRAQDERLADVGRERDDEDDFGEILRLHPVLASLRPSQDAKAQLPALD